MPKVKCLAIVFAIGSSGVHAQEHCNSLIRQGINNIESRYDSSYQFEYNFDKYCRADMSKQSDSFVATAEASIFGYGSGSGDTNSNSTREKITNWCSENEEKFENNTLKITKSQRLAKSALNAWEKCLELDQKGVKVTLNSTLANSEQVDIQLDSTLDTILQLQSISVEGFICDISGTDRIARSALVIPSEAVTKRAGGVVRVGETSGFDTYPLNISLGASNININCDRKAPETTDDGMIVRQKWGVGQITINTDSIQYPVSFPEIVSDYIATPPGAVVSFLDSCPAGWTVFHEAANRFVFGAQSLEEIGSIGGREKLTPDGSHKHRAAHGDYDGTRFGNDNTDDSWHTAGAGNHDHGEGGSILPPFVSLLYCVKSSR